MFNDNINKIPRDLSEVGPDQKIFQSSVKLFGRVEPFDNTTSTSVVQYNPPNTPIFAANISTLAEANYKNNIGADLEYVTFYNSEANPYIARLNTAKKIGKDEPTTSSNFGISLSILETEAVESALDIYWETTTAGLVEDLNLEVKQASSSTAPVALSSTVAAQNENFPINTDVFGSLSTPINAIDSSGQTVIGQSFSIISSTRGNGNALLAKDVNNSSVDPFNIFASGNGFYIQTNGFFNVSTNAVENNFNITIRVTDNTNLTFVDFVVSWTLGNTPPSFGATPTFFSPINTTGPIANSDYSVNAVNGTNSAASLAQRQEDLIFSIAADTVENSLNVVDASGNNYGFSINSTGTSLSQNGPLLPPNDTYTIPIILRDAGGLTATHNQDIQVTAGLATTFALNLSNQTGGTYTGSMDFEVDITYGGSPTTSTPVTNLQTNVIGSPSNSMDVKFATLNPPPTNSNTLTFDITIQNSQPTFFVPPGTTLSIEVYANRQSASSLILSKTLTQNTPISTTQPISLNPSNDITGTDLTTSTSLGFSVNIELL